MIYQSLSFEAKKEQMNELTNDVEHVYLVASKISLVSCVIYSTKNILIELCAEIGCQIL